MSGLSTHSRLTILIAARNAGASIERAVLSTRNESDCRVILIDDHSGDDTVARARRAADGRLRVVGVRGPGGVPLARQAGLEAVETEFAGWLDADDAWLPGRGERIVEALDAGADVFSDPVDLVDGATECWLRRLKIPEFIQRECNPARLFERNHLPGDTQVGFRVATFRAAGGYDSEVYGAESFDILLRAIARGAVFSYGDQVGYRMYSYAGSVSRNLARQRAALAIALKKHDYERIRQLCRAAGQSERVAAWVLVSMALFRNEADAALRFLETASPADSDPDVILEPDGPWLFREGWRRTFQRGTCLALLGGRDEEAMVELARAEALEHTAECANNLGVVWSRLGKLTDARECWEKAQQTFPGYLDARLNLESPSVGRITTHPLRRQASRSEY